MLYSSLLIHDYLACVNMQAQLPTALSNVDDNHIGWLMIVGGKRT